MHYRRHIFRYGLLALLGAMGRSAPAAPASSPQPLKLEWGEVYLQTEVEYQNERQSAGSPAAVFTHTQTRVEPVVGFGLDGSVYHPNLVQFHLDAELGMDWEDTEVNPGGSASSWKFLQRYHGVVDFLEQKAYATSFFADKDMTYRDYDFFSRVRIESEQYGGRTGYTAGPLPVIVSVQHYDEVEENPSRPRDFRQDTVSFNTQNKRELFDGNTRLTYSLNDFTRHDDGFNTTHGVSHNLNLCDTEVLGARKQARLTSLLNYSCLTETVLPTDQLLAQEDLRLQHTPKLDSYYTYLFNTSAAGSSEANTHDAHAGINYQWLSDLAAGLDAQGDTTHSASPGSSLEADMIGAGLNTQYTPTLSTWSQLTVSDDVHFDHEDRNASGLTQNILSESHTLTDGNVTLLSQPDVTAGTVHVWGDVAHSLAYFEGVDYLVISAGVYTQIQRVPGGTIPNGSVVYVDYTAKLQGKAAYDTLANTAMIRLDLWRGLLGIYGRWAYQTYNGGANLQLRQLDDKTIGIDSAWRWFRAGAEYETVDSNLAPYNRARFIQSAHFQPGEKTDLSLNADEGWTDFLDSHIRQTSYGFITRLQQRLTSRLTGGAEGGIRIERGDTFDRDLATCRLWLDWAIGKVTVKVSYEFNDENHRVDNQNRHYVFVRIRRDFR